MGKPLVNVKLWNLLQDADVQAGRVAPLEREALADTDATYVVLPKKLADDLGLPSAGKRRIRYADGRIEEKRLVGALLIEAAGRTTECRAVVEDNGLQILIGKLALEDLDLYVDCQGRRLVPRPESPDMPMAEEYGYDSTTHNSALRAPVPRHLPRWRELSTAPRKKLRSFLGPQFAGWRVVGQCRARSRAS